MLSDGLDVRVGRVGAAEPGDLVFEVHPDQGAKGGRGILLVRVVGFRVPLLRQGPGLGRRADLA